MFHPVQGGSGAAICAGGAMGGLDGPAGGLFARLPGLLMPRNVSVLRLDYRQPDAFEECVLDILAGCSFLKGIGATDAVLVGHSFGGAVVVKAGSLHPIVRAVASLSPQLYGTRQVEELARPLLLVHGSADEVLDSEASEDIYRRAAEPGSWSSTAMPATPSGASEKRSTTCCLMDRGAPSGRADGERAHR